VLRPEAVRSRLLKLEEVISRLEELGRAKDTSFIQSWRDTWAVERGLPFWRYPRIQALDVLRGLTVFGILVVSSNSSGEVLGMGDSR
jgi:hypothetical protein